MKIPYLSTGLSQTWGSTKWSFRKLHLFIHRYSNELSFIMLSILLAMSIVSSEARNQEATEQMDELEAVAENVQSQLEIVRGQAEAREEVGRKVSENMQAELNKQTRYLECVLTAMGEESEADNVREDCRQQTGFQPTQGSVQTNQNNSQNSQEQNNSQDLPPGLEKRCRRAI